MANSYIVFNGAMPTTASVATVASGNPKTMIQIKAPANQSIEVIEWGISFVGTTVATPVICELLQTDVAATITAYVAADIMALNNLGGSNGLSSTLASQIQIGSTTNSGYTSSGEGSITATRVFDTQNVSPAGSYIKQYPLGERPIVVPGKFLRIRTTDGGSHTNCICYINYSE